MTENAVWFRKRVRAGGLWRTKQRYLQSHLTLDKSAVTHLSPLQQRCASSEHAHISAAGVCAGSASKQVHLFLFSSTVQPNTRLKTPPRRPARLFRISSPCRWEECDVLLYEWERGKKGGRCSRFHFVWMFKLLSLAFIKTKTYQTPPPPARRAKQPTVLLLSSLRTILLMFYVEFCGPGCVRVTQHYKHTPLPEWRC